MHCSPTFDNYIEEVVFHPVDYSAIEEEIRWYFNDFAQRQHPRKLEPSYNYLKAIALVRLCKYPLIRSSNLPSKALLINRILKKLTPKERATLFAHYGPNLPSDMQEKWAALRSDLRISVPLFFASVSRNNENFQTIFSGTKGSIQKRISQFEKEALVNLRQAQRSYVHAKSQLQASFEASVGG